MEKYLGVVFCSVKIEPNEEGEWFIVLGYKMFYFLYPPNPLQRGDLRVLKVCGKNIRQKRTLTNSPFEGG